MKIKKRKIFPKIKKKLKWFLTDESWKITKQGALWIAAWATLLAGISEVNAGCSLGGTDTHRAQHSNSDNHSCSPVSVNHASWIVNGHYSSTPWYTGWNLQWHHSSSASLQWSNNMTCNHGSWGWC